MERAATAARVCRQLQDDLDPLNDARIRTAIIARDNWNLRSVGPLAKAENRSQRNEWHVQHSPFLLFALLCGCEAFLRNPQPASALWLRRKPWTSPSTAALYSTPPISGGTCVAAADAKTNALASSEIAASAIAAADLVIGDDGEIDEQAPTLFQALAIEKFHAVDIQTTQFDRKSTRCVVIVPARARKLPPHPPPAPPRPPLHIFFVRTLC